MTEQNAPGQERKAAEGRPSPGPTANRPPEQESQSKTAADKVAKADLPDDDNVLVNPYPAYEEMSLSELRSQAQSRGTGVPRDVEKAHLVYLLRTRNTQAPEYDLMPLDQLRELAGEDGATLDEDLEKAHLITALRAADTTTR